MSGAKGKKASGNLKPTKTRERGKTQQKILLAWREWNLLKKSLPLRKLFKTSVRTYKS